MSTDVEDQVVYHAIEHLDFEPVCEISWAWFFKFFGLRIDSPFRHPCSRPARWRGIGPCGHFDVLVCDQHRRDNSIGYPCCVRYLALNLNWRKI